MNCTTVGARAHHSAPAVNTDSDGTNGARRPNVSDRRSNTGLAVQYVSRNTVENHVAAWEAAKYIEMTGWDEAMSVESKEAINHVIQIHTTRAANRGRLIVGG